MNAPKTSGIKIAERWASDEGGMGFLAHQSAARAARALVDNWRNAESIDGEPLHPETMSADIQEVIERLQDLQGALLH